MLEITIRVRGVQTDALGAKEAAAMRLEELGDVEVVEIRQVAETRQMGMFDEKPGAQGWA
ncbi:MAG: hypothetical protein IKH03_02425 [Oscillospiraceae bacterium]|nr:hypothetical protein [Oscillospiraceae bacterium]